MVNLTKGSSENDSITFYSNKSEATARRKENGEIEISFNQKEEKPENFSKKQILILCILLVGIILLFDVLILILFKKLNFLHIWYLIPIFIYSIILIAAIVSVRKASNSKMFLKNHAAEHMTYKAYKVLKRVPTIVEIKHFSRLSKHCGITLFTSLIISHTVGFVIYSVTQIAIPQTVIFLFSDIIRRCFPFYFIGLPIQLLTTSKPDDVNLELALAAISALEEQETKVEENSNIVFHFSKSEIVNHYKRFF